MKTSTLTNQCSCRSQAVPTCRFCQTPLTDTFVDLGKSPLSNRYLDSAEEIPNEPFFPLHAWVCEKCFLVQLEKFETPENIFGDYAYFSSCSASWVEHARKYVGNMIPRLHLSPESKVVELASNDGYLLQFFVKAGIPVLGIEPARNIAAVANEKGIPTEAVFFGQETARKLLADGHAADLLLGNNVLAHVPDINDFVAGMQILLKPDGVITMEFPHLLRLIEQNQFDTIYHEHFSYLSFGTVSRIFEAHGLRMFDVQELPTHGGSLRIFACHADSSRRPEPSVQEQLERERQFGLGDLETYRDFGLRCQIVRDELLNFLQGARDCGKTVAGYGAPAKGNTLLNYAGVTPDLLPYTVDISPAKQGKLLPGTHIPILSPQAILDHQPDYVLILPWNLREEIVDQMAAVREWGGQFVVPIPRLEVLS